MDEYRIRLNEVDNLCRNRRIPMSSSLVQEVKEIYEKGLSLEIDSKETPLMLAADCRYYDLVWGFIQCAKQSNTNLHTGGTLDLQEFLGYRNLSGQTALHMAAKKYNNDDVIRVLLQEVSVQHLISYRDESGKTPISVLERDDMYDEEIFKVMEAAASKGDQVDPTKSILMSTDHKQQGLVIYTEIEMDPNSRPTSHINETRKSLNKLDYGELELTENRSTILHLVSEFGDTDYAKDILKRHPSLVHNRNIKGETPFYVAASEGHIDILEILIDYAKCDELKELATRSTDKDTALHIAIQKHHVGVVFWLVKRIPQLANHVNDLKESPLYLASDKNFHAVVKLIVKECKEKAYDGPDRKTALHAAVISDSGGYYGSERCTQSLLQANIGLLKIKDKDGWTPLHYAAKLGRSDMISNLLKKRSHNIENEITTTDDITTSAFDITDTNGRNMLHVAIENKKADIIQLIFEDESLASLSNQKDDRGNTPLHLLEASSDLEMEGIIIDSTFNIDALWRGKRKTPPQTESPKKKVKKPTTLLGTIGNGLLDVAKSFVDDTVQAGRFIDEEFKKQRFKSIGDKIVIVVTLIATATFAAAFTVPGGFDSSNKGPDQGMPLLLKKAAYKVFVVANAVAFSCSGTVLFGQIRLQLDDVGDDVEPVDVETSPVHIISLQYLFTGFAMIAMATAFVAGTYVILTPSLGLAISVCAICLCIMVPFSIMPRRYLGIATTILTKLA